MLRLIAGCAVAIAWMLAASPAALPQATAPTTIRFIAAPSDDLLPFWYAQSAGLFRAAGLNVVADKAPSGAVVAQSVVGGAADVGRASLSSLLAAHVHGIPFVLFAPSAIHRKGTSVNSAVIVAANSPLKSVLELQGKTVSCTAIGDIGYLGTRALIDAQGGDSSTVKWVEIPISAVAAAIDQGRIDAGVSSEPFMSRDLATGKVRMLVDMLEGYPGEILEGAYFSMRDYAAANADAIARFQRVMREASIYTNAHAAQMLPLLVANTGMEPDVAARMRRALAGVAFEPSQIQPVIDAAAKYKIIPQRFDARELFWTKDTK
jgi:NitT/TauT family transport system substrate-binding protein